MKFEECGFNENLLKGISEAGYVDCTEVQEKVIRYFTEKKGDLYVQSQTGTGKTAAYLIPILNECLKDRENSQILIMTPTRELAVQVEEEAKELAKYTGLKCASFYGGVGYESQKNALRKGCDVIIGTPGRLIDLHEGKDLNLSKIKFLVVDEADRMFDMGFYPDLRTIIKFLPDSQNRQTMLFSATLNTYVKNLAWEYTSDAEEITIESENITVSEISQMLFHVSADEKLSLLLGILNTEKPESAIVFCNTKKNCEIVAKRLQINKIDCDFIIGDLPQSKRLKIINSFKDGKLRFLCATDVAARGIDVNDLAMVINYDLPNEVENYVHRIGRTARAGKTGKAYTFCSERDVYDLPAIEKYIDMKIPSTMPTDEQFMEDASRDVYIRLDSDDSREGDSRGRDNRSRDGRGPSRSRKFSGEDRSSQRGGNRSSFNGRKSAKSEVGRERNKSRKNASSPAVDKISTKEALKLESLSFEERMKFYKSRYSGENTSHKKKFENSKGNRGGKKDYGKQFREKKAPRTMEQKRKEGFLAKLLSVFKKK